MQKQVLEVGKVKMMDAKQILGRRERGKAAKRARILAAARRGIAERGFDAMTMAEVAQEADVAVGTVFQYAATKAELLMMVTAERWRGAVAVGGEMPEDKGGLRAQILALTEPVIEEALVDPDTTMAIARELLFGAEGPHRAAVLELVTGLESHIEAMMTRAGADPKQSSVAARMIVSSVLLETNRTRRQAAEPNSLRERIAAVVELTTAGAFADREQLQGG